MLIESREFTRKNNKVAKTGKAFIAELKASDLTISNKVVGLLDQIEAMLPTLAENKQFQKLVELLTEVICDYKGKEMTAVRKMTYTFYNCAVDLEYLTK